MSRPRAAMTLIELILVMLILAIVATNAVPRFADSLSRQRLRSATRRVQFDLNAARQRARNNCQAESIIFIPAVNRYAVPNAQSLKRRSGVYVVDLGESPYRASVTSARFRAVDDLDVEFSGFGVPDSGGVIDVQVGPLTQSVTVDSDTGEVQISEVTRWR